MQRCLAHLSSKRHKIMYIQWNAVFLHMTTWILDDDFRRLQRWDCWTGGISYQKKNCKWSNKSVIIKSKIYVILHRAFAYLHSEPQRRKGTIAIWLHEHNTLPQAGQPESHPIFPHIWECSHWEHFKLVFHGLRTVEPTGFDENFMLVLCLASQT